MKTLISKLLSLQTKFAFILGMSLLVAGTSCQKNDDDKPSAITDEEAAAIVEGALLANTEGLAREAFDAAVVTEQSLEKTTTNLECGETRDTSISRTWNVTNFSAAYTGTWSWTLNCNAQNLPSSLVYIRTASGQYETPRVKSDDSASSQWTVSSLTSGLFYILNGSYTRQGSQMSKIGDQNTFTSNVVFAVTDLKVSKLTKLINSGLSTFTITGQSTTGASFTVVGSVEFLGDGGAIITINGQTWEVDLY